MVNNIPSLVNANLSQILQGFTALCMLIITFVISYYQVKKLKEEKTPFLFIDEVLHSKINMAIDIEDFSKENYYLSKGSNQSLNSLEKYMKVRQNVQGNGLFSVLEKAFLEEASTYYGDKAYFTYFNSNPIMMLNFVNNDKNVVIEHCNTKIKLKNYGALVTKMRVNRVIIQYASGEERTLQGVDELVLSSIIDKDEHIMLMLDEATTNLEHSLCYIDSEDYKKMPLGDFDLLRTRTPVELKYKILKFEFTVWNRYNKSFDMDLSITYSGNILTPETKLK